MKNRIILIILIVVSVFIGCKKDTVILATCSDGIQNQSETGIDCGGECAPCSTISVILGDSPQLEKRLKGLF